ncbi:hypothetical protein [Yoonia sp.]|uniref:hypothetical protein n=1 Tax=Yoonia sp. TaxID=2212373 RepID=UPI002E0B2A09|nr:hypothetical protein [Yoonia sp.]
MTKSRACCSENELIDITGIRQGAFDATVANATDGSRILYHLGEYCAGPHKKDARTAYEDGRVVLAIRKRSKWQFEYLAIPVSRK